MNIISDNHSFIADISNSVQVICGKCSNFQGLLPRIHQSNRKLSDHRVISFNNNVCGMICPTNLAFHKRRCSDT